MTQDNTAVIDEVDASVEEQNTVDESTETAPVEQEVKKETKEAEEQRKFLGKYNSIDDAEKAFTNIQERARQSEEKLKALQKAQDERASEEFSKMDYDQQVLYLKSRDQARQEELEAIYNALNGKVQEADQVVLEKFIASEPLLQETGFDNELRLLSTHPELQGYTIESIFNTLLKPKIEKIMGTKIKVKDRKIVSDNQSGGTDYSQDITNLSDAEYAKQRTKILKSAGINF